MPHDRRIAIRRLVALAILVGLTGLVASMVRGSDPPDGPEPVAWNRQACAHCRMLVGEPRHAAQLITTDREVAFFDDPGCLLRYLDERRPSVHRMWFHDHGSDRWLGETDVGFVTGVKTPMGYGLAAVARSTAGALDLASARHRVAAPRAGVAP